jgi:hypothetical protein
VVSQAARQRSAAEAVNKKPLPDGSERGSTARKVW